ncbi:13607_t:CDS:2 [Funneliformis mosseae]|uniref:13607_t:CDS:1 n=1 Tax=Funneliformis mosseae TaxID=27381 RepID=A0A9N8ZMS8_FUNMO|nr:13607_t:CDS:2 [Funneliformis mosseae]
MSSLKNISKCNSETVSNLIIQSIQENGLDITKCILLITDNTAYMSSNKNGAVSLFNKKTDTSAFQIGCSLHIMQIVLNHFEQEAFDQMDNVYNKRHLFEVYSSEEEIDDINELQDKYEYESVSSKEEYSLFSIEAGDVFESWDLAEKQVQSSAKNTGFEVKKFQLEKNKEGEIVRRTFKCKFSGVYHLTGSLVYVISLCNEHNHFFVKKENLVSNRHLGPEILKEIEFLVNIGCRAGPIILALQKHFPKIVIHPKYIYNAICHIQNSQNKSKTDAAETFEKLMKLQLDNHVRSRIVTTAIVSEETKETYQWILKCLLSATDNLALNVLFTDADPAIVLAIHETLPSTKYNYCIWHLRKNLDKNLRGQLHKNYNEFVKAWNKYQNFFLENEFQKQWHKLLTSYPTAKKYLTLKSSATLFELDTHIQSLLNKEQQFEQHEQSNQNSTVGLPNVVRRYFKRIDAIIKKFLTPRVLKMQHNQMNESLLYCVDKVENWKDLLENEIVEQDEDGEDGEEQQSDDEEQSDNKEQSDDEE